MSKEKWFWYWFHHLLHYSDQPTCSFLFPVGRRAHPSPLDGVQLRGADILLLQHDLLVRIYIYIFIHIHIYKYMYTYICIFMSFYIFARCELPRRRNTPTATWSSGKEIYVYIRTYSYISIYIYIYIGIIMSFYIFARCELRGADQLLLQHELLVSSFVLSKKKTKNMCLGREALSPCACACWVQL